MGVWGAVLSVQRSGSCLGLRPHLVGRLRDLVSWQWTRGAPRPLPLPTHLLPPSTAVCSPSLCFNGGHCVSGSAQPCRCPPGFQGPRCQHGEWCPPQVLHAEESLMVGGGGVSGALTPLPAAPFLMDASAPSSESIPSNSTLCGWGQWAWRQTGMNQGPWVSWEAARPRGP